MISIEEKLKIANAGGSFEEDFGNSSWVGTLIKKGEKHGEVIRDRNGSLRQLTVLFNDLRVEEIVMNNVGKDTEEVHQYEWYSDGKWYRF